MDIKFSILIPAYKKLFLKEAISSILEQSYSNIEIVIVDDCSPEDLKSVVDCFSDIRVKYYRNEKNYGAEHVVGNWNKCLSYATGNYVLCMGDDDKLTPDCLQNCTKYIDENRDVSVFHLQTLLIDENSEVIDIQEGRPAWESVYSATFNKLKGRLQYIGDWLFKTESLRNCGGFFDLPFAWYSDDITPLIVGKEYGIINIPEFGFQYRVSSQTISSDDKNIEGKIDACRKAYLWYKNFISGTVCNASDKVYQQCILRQLPEMGRKAIIKTLSSGMANGRLRAVFRLFRDRKKLNITIATIMTSLIYSMKSLSIVR